MNKKDLWQVFMKTGKVSDYLNYKNARDTDSFPIEEEEEFSEELTPDYERISRDDFSDFEEDLNY